MRLILLHFTCRLNWMSYVLKFPFSCTLTLILSSQTILFFIQAKKSNDNHVWKSTSQKEYTSSVSFLKKRCFYYKEEKVEHKYNVPWFQYIPTCKAVDIYIVHKQIILCCCCVGLCKLTLTRYLIPQAHLFILG